MRIHPLASGALAMAAAHTCVQAQSFTIAVFNKAAAPRTTLAPAIEAARLALREARIESHWVVCEPKSCAGEGISAPSFEIYLLPELRKPSSDYAGGEPAGYAMRIGFARPRAYVSYQAAGSIAESTARPESVALACVMAHEIGHLLGLEHQAHGIMRANLDAAEMDNAMRGRAFDSRERDQLRRALALGPGSMGRGSGVGARGIESQRE